MATQRVQTQDPLLGATPALKPVARPLAVRPGATPAPQRSPLMELADAFGDFQPTLRELLRDTAAREEQDAQALGEIEATRLRAEQRLGELDKVLKQKVDSGELPAVRLPAAQRGAALRIGREHAEVGLQTYLDQRMNAVASGQANLEETVNEALTRFSSNIPGGAFYERQGFDKAAQEIVSNWRFRVSKAAEAEQVKFQRESRANEGTELAVQLATAKSDSIEPAKAYLKAFFDATHGELPKSEVTRFFTDEVVAPAVRSLIEKRDFTAAEQLLEEVRTLGAGSGPYGGTSYAREKLPTLTLMVNEARDRWERADPDRLANIRQQAEEQGLASASKLLAERRRNNGGKILPHERAAILAQLTDLQLSDQAYNRAVEVVNVAIENEERYSRTPQIGANLRAAVRTLDTDALDLVKAQADAELLRGTIPADEHEAIVQQVNRNKNLIGIYDDSEADKFQRAVFAQPGLVRGTTTINVGDPAVGAVWDGLAPADKDVIVKESTQQFVQAYLDRVRTLAGNDPAKAEQVKTVAFNEASATARDFVVSRLKTQYRQQAADTAARRVEDQRRIITLHRRLFPLRDDAEAVTRSVATQDSLSLLGSSVDLYGFNPTPELAKKPEEKPEKSKPEPRDLTKTLDKQRTLPSSEWDVVVLPVAVNRVLSKDSKIRRGVVDLEALASDTDPDSQRYYAVAKAVAGFTPEEIKAKKTKHGVPFEPAEIDPTAIPVFRNVAELNKAYNGGQLSDLFLEVGDLIDPKNKLTPEKFYAAQLAILSSR